MVLEMLKSFFGDLSLENLSSHSFRPGHFCLPVSYLRTEVIAQPEADRHGHDSDSEDKPEESRRQKQAKHQQCALQFLQGGVGSECMERFYILRRALAAEVDLMHRIVELNSPALFFERAEGILQGQPPQSHLLSLHLAATERDDSCFHQFFLKHARLVQDDSLWHHLTATEAMSTHIIRYALRTPAVFFELVWRRLSMWPYKLFKLLAHPEAAPELFAEGQRSPCMLDTFSAKFLQQFPSPQELQSQGALLTLQLVGLAAVHNIYNVEQMHSSNARRSRQRVHTHSMKVEDMAMWLQSSSSPPWWQPSQQDSSLSVQRYIGSK